jgi:hypothetical protein
MKVLNAVKASRWRTAILATVLTGALAGSAFAAVSGLTMDSTAALSPGHLHAVLTGTVTCDAGTTVFLNGQVVQRRNVNVNVNGYGFTSVACNGTSQRYALDVSTGGSGVFKVGKANAEVSTTECTEVTCTSKYVDAVIHLTR